MTLAASSSPTAGQPETPSSAQKSKSDSDREHGIYIRGEYLGVQEARSFTRTGTTEEVKVRPKVGISVDGEELAVAAKDDEHLARTVRGWVKGDTVDLRVEARPPFGSRGSVSYVLPGVIESRRESWR